MLQVSAALRRIPVPRTGAWSAPARQLSSSISCHHEPLHVLFCGSDEFSVVSLRRLQEESQKRPDLIASLQVLCKKGKPVGRGLKEIRDGRPAPESENKTVLLMQETVPIKAAAQGLCLPTSEITTFTGWSPPKHIRWDLIIAVSFGLLIPSRILKSTTYGGLNVHPSLLPDLQGPAPLHQALLEGRRRSGITVQTLHPTAFDKGVIIKQWPFDIPKDGACGVEELRDYVAPHAAGLLLECLSEGSFLEAKHVEENGDHETPGTARSPQPERSFATKVNPEDTRVDWQSWDSERILRAQRVLGPLWSLARSRKSAKVLRIKWHGLASIPSAASKLPPVREGDLGSHSPGEPCIVESAVDSQGNNVTGKKSRRVALKTIDDQVLTMESVTIEGRKKHEDPVQAISLLRNGKI